MAAASLGVSCVYLGLATVHFSSHATPVIFNSPSCLPAIFNTWGVAPSVYPRKGKIDGHEGLTGRRGPLGSRCPGASCKKPVFPNPSLSAPSETWQLSSCTPCATALERNLPCERSRFTSARARDFTARPALHSPALHPSAKRRRRGRGGNAEFISKTS